MRKVTALLIPTTLLFVWSCRGKQGPQGPQGPQGNPGRDLTRPQQGYIEGRARGKDNAGNAFDFTFRYSYYFAVPGAIQALSGNIREIFFERSDSAGLGNISIRFRFNPSNNQTSDVTIEGNAVELRGNTVSAYALEYYLNAPGLPRVTREIRNVRLLGDTACTGEFVYIRETGGGMIPNTPSNTHPDTVSGTFNVKLLPVRSYGRTAGAN
ncbi:MAG: hypothetical protein NZ580_01845 [Bacteroidia bacterium]|nr:hypothetical protein [Bacteroidia bacterium]MDW8235960.1 hypothetical protein [Bacteroidia bacterium]